MNGSSVTLDKVSIQIEASAASAQSNIDALATTLKTLKTNISGGFNNLSKLAKSLEELKSATKGLSVATKNLDNLSSIQSALQGLSNISNPKGFQKAIANIEKLPSAFNKINPQVLENMSRVSRELAASLSPLADKLGQISQGYSAINQLADRYGKSATKIRTYTKQSSNSNKVLSDTLDTMSRSYKNLIKFNEQFAKSVTKRASSIISKVKQIGLSLLGTRTIFTATRKAVSEYMAMDAELTWEITNNWRALGAQLAPAIENVTWLFKQFVRVIYSIILALTGIDLIARANAKAMEGWGKAAKSTLGNLQKFDDLNVVEFPKGTGDEDKLIQLDEIDLSPIQKVIDWVRKLRDEIKAAWNSGEWEGVGKVLAEGLNGAIDAVNFDTLEKKLQSIAKKFGSFLQGAINNFNWKAFGTKLTRQLSLIPRTISMFLNEVPWEDIGTRLTEALETFKPNMIITSIFDAIGSLGDGLQKAFLKIKPKVIAEKIEEAISSVFTNFKNLLDKIEWQEIGNHIREVIININWAELWQKAVDAFQEAFSGLKDFVIGITGLDSDTINTIADAFLKIGEAFVAYKIVSGITIFADKILTIATSPIGAIALSLLAIVQLTKDIINLIKDPSVVENWQKLTKDIAIFGGIAAVLLIAYFAMKKFNSGVGDVAKTTKDVAKGGGIFTSLFGDIGKTVKIMAVLGGLALVLQSVSDLLRTMSETGMTVADVFQTLGSIFLVIAGLMASIVIFGPAMAAGLGPFLIVIGSISALLGVMALTLPTILDATADFIERVAPKLNDVLNTIGNNINKIIHSLGDVLPPIINSVGKVFKTIFDGISKVVKTMGDSIVRVLDAVGRLAETIFSSIINFINRLGPAVNNLVDNLITATTKLVNFVVSGIEFMINGIISAINGLSSGLRKIGNKLFDLIGVDVKIEPISKVYLDRFYPKLETGTNRVPYEGIYHLHKDEAVVPKKYNPAMGGGTNDDTNRRLDMLIDIVANMETTNIVNIGNDQLYKQQKKYTDRKVNKYGTIEVQ